MHESPVAHELVEAALREAAANADDKARVTSMQINLGPEGGYLPDSLRMHILAAAKGTAAESVSVEITTKLEGGPELASIEIEESA